eukprot:6705921-Alexandrium_andersonii.AAC.1
MADFELQRGALALFAEQRDSLVKPRLDQLMRSFRECLQEAARKHVAGRQAGWFEGIRAPALTHVGFCSLVSCVAARPKWDLERGNAAACKLLELRPGFKPHHTQEWLQGTCALQIAPVRTKVACACSLSERPAPCAEEPLASPCRFRCPGGCSTIHSLPAMPKPVRGEWPKLWRARCSRKLRVGAGTCVVCDAPPQQVPTPNQGQGCWGSTGE